MQVKVNTHKYVHKTPDFWKGYINVCMRQIYQINFSLGFRHVVWAIAQVILH
jgi:hypothetical protein